MKTKKCTFCLFPLFFQSIVKHEINLNMFFEVFYWRPKGVPFVISIIFSEQCQARDQSYGAQIAQTCIKLGYSYTCLAFTLSGSSFRVYLLSLSLILKVVRVVKRQAFLSWTPVQWFNHLYRSWQKFVFWSNLLKINTTKKCTF